MIAVIWTRRLWIFFVCLVAAKIVLPPPVLQENGLTCTLFHPATSLPVFHSLGPRAFCGSGLVLEVEAWPFTRVGGA